jgi:hypothetical protein
MGYFDNVFAVQLVFSILVGEETAKWLMCHPEL